MTQLRTTNYSRPEPRNRHPVVLELFRIINRRKVTYGSMEEASGLGRDVVSG